MEGTVSLEFYDVFESKKHVTSQSTWVHPPGSLGTDPLPPRSEGRRGLNLHRFHASPVPFSTTAPTRQATPASPSSQHIHPCHTINLAGPEPKSDPLRPLESRATPLGRQPPGGPPLAAAAARAGIRCRDRGPHRTVSRANLDSMPPPSSLGHHSFIFLSACLIRRFRVRHSAVLRLLRLGRR